MLANNVVSALLSETIGVCVQPSSLYNKTALVLSDALGRLVGAGSGLVRDKYSFMCGSVPRSAARTHANAAVVITCSYPILILVNI